MYVFDAIPQASTDEDPVAEGLSFEDGLRLDAEAAEAIHSALVRRFGWDFRWCFEDAPEVEWDWSDLLRILEGGHGWSLPAPDAPNQDDLILRIYLTMEHQIARNYLEFRARRGKSRAFELKGVQVAPDAPRAMKKLALDMKQALRALKARRKLERTAVADEIRESYGDSTLELFEALASGTRTELEDR